MIGQKIADEYNERLKPENGSSEPSPGQPGDADHFVCSNSR